MRKIKYGSSNITFPKGFKAGGVDAGISKTDKPDLGILVSDISCQVAGVFTKNQFIAAPIEYSKKIVEKEHLVKAIVVNSGNANAGTGTNGETVVKKTVSLFARELHMKNKEILTFSTGSVGCHLPVKKIESASKNLLSELNVRNGELFTQSILTTDSFKKTKSAELEIDGKIVRIGASCKGAGMIEPSMATMLCFISTDVFMPKKLLQEVLSEACNSSFNRISVDGDMSTNDSVVLLANGASGVIIKNKKSKGFLQFQEALKNISCFLARKIISDGEGATKIINVRVSGAKSENEACAACHSVANSLLLKCAINGEQPGWGRVLASVGSSTASINRKKFSIRMQRVFCFKKGEPDFNAVKKIKPLMKKKEIEIEINLGAGKYEFSMLSSDIGHRYVEINVM